MPAPPEEEGGDEGDEEAGGDEDGGEVDGGRGARLFRVAQVDGEAEYVSLAEEHGFDEGFAGCVVALDGAELGVGAGGVGAGTHEERFGVEPAAWREVAERDVREGDGDVDGPGAVVQREVAGAPVRGRRDGEVVLNKNA